MKTKLKIISKNFSLFLLLLFGYMIFFNIALALPEDRNKPLTLQADFAEFNRQTGVGTYRGNVVVDQGNTHITGDLMYTYLDKQETLKEIIVHGTKDKRAHYWTLLKPDEPVSHARAMTIKYSPKKQIVILIKKAEIAQDKNIFRGPYITYDIQTQLITSRQIKNDNGGRTTIVFHPKQKKSS